MSRFKAYLFRESCSWVTGSLPNFYMSFTRKWTELSLGCRHKYGFMWHTLSHLLARVLWRLLLPALMMMNALCVSLRVGFSSFCRLWKKFQYGFFENQLSLWNIWLWSVCRQKKRGFRTKMPMKVISKAKSKTVERFFSFHSAVWKTTG